MRNLARVVSFGLIAFLGLALLVPAGASSAKKNRVPALLTYKAMVHVAGGVTFTSHKDTFQNCMPGQRWTMQEDGDVDVRGTVLIETYKNQQIRSGSAVEPGGAQNKGQLTTYEESNYCPPDDPVELDQPSCDSNTGKGVAVLQPDPRRSSPRRVSIGISRRGGGEQDLSCIWGLPSRATPTGAIVSPLESVFSSIVLPLDISIKQIRTLGVKKRLIRTVRVGGTCAAPIVYRGKKIPSDTTDMDDGECVADGDFVITIKRLNRISRQGVPVN